jgi:arylsulfatase A-like enzyme
VLVTLDTTRADHCSAYGYSRETTPTLERVAAEGVRFAVAYAPSATTGPTHATLFTSLYPPSHGVLKNGIALAPPYVTLAERLRERGYTSAAFVSSFVLDPKFGWDQGFDAFDAEFAPEGETWHGATWEGRPVGVFDRRADATIARARAWLERGRDASRPFFLFVHLFDPHKPYVPPEEYARRFPPAEQDSDDLRVTIAKYDAEIAFADAQLGELLAALEALGLARDTLLLVTADHGEGLMQHGHLEHGVHIYEEQVRVPLLVRWPARLAAGRVVESAVSLVDVVPTVLELLGAPPAEGLGGTSLVPELDGKARLDPTRPIFLYRQLFPPTVVESTPVRGEKFGVRIGAWKYILGPEEGSKELYDLSQDPGERTNRFPLDPQRADFLASRMESWRASLPRAAAGPGVSEEDREKLRALGYTE